MGACATRRRHKAITDIRRLGVHPRRAQAPGTRELLDKLTISDRHSVRDRTPIGLRGAVTVRGFFPPLIGHFPSTARRECDRSSGPRALGWLTVEDVFREVLVTATARTAG